MAVYATFVGERGVVPARIFRDAQERLLKRKGESMGQAEKFKRLARELECDEDEEAFKAKLRKVATAPKPKAEPNR